MLRRHVGSSFVSSRLVRAPGSSVSFAHAATRGAAQQLPMTGGLDALLNPTDEHRMLRETVARFAREKLEPQAMQADIDGTFNRALFCELGSKGLGLFGLTIPAEAGGVGMDATASVIVHHELAKIDGGVCLAYLAHAMLFVNNFYWSATAEQRARFLPGVLSGDVIGAMGMSEPSAGTDVLGMKTNAKRAPGANGGGYVLNGSKTWITNGPHADVFLVYARNVDKSCVTAFLIERGMPGFSTGPKIDKLGDRSSEMCTLYFDNVHVPDANVLGGKDNGLVSMMRNLELERVSGAGMSCGIAERCVELMIEYGAQRQAFGHPINSFGQIQRYIAENFAAVEAAKALTYAVSRTVAPGHQNRIGTDAAKLVAAPTAKRAADAAIQVLGGMGYARGPAERLWRDSRLGEIGAGTLEAHHKNLIKDLTAAAVGK